MMARGIQLCGGVAALALMLTHGAQAATPTVAGTYAMMGWHICQLTVATPKSSVSDVTGTIKVKAVTDIFSSTKNVIAAVTPQSDTFLKPGDTQGSAIVSLPTTPGTIIQDVGPTSRIDFVTAVNTANVLAVTSLEQNLTGGNSMISMSVGTVTFPSTPVSSGSASFSSVEVLGHAMRNTSSPGDTGGFKRNPASGMTTGTGTFSFTSPTTLKLNTEIRDISVGDVDGNGVARTLYIIRRPASSDHCMDAMTLTKH
jgi:hypothetical protein